MDLTRLNDAVGAVATAVVAIVLGWLLVAALLARAAALPGAVGRMAARLDRVVVPRLLRRCLAATLGVGLLATPASARQAGPFERLQEPPAPTAAPSPSATRPSPSATPSASESPTPTASATPSRAPVQRTEPTIAPAPAPVPPDVVVVRPGDTLWHIAEQRLTDPTPRRIDATWRRWYAANRDVVGADPNLIRPGQRLSPPADPAAQGELP